MKRCSRVPTLSNEQGAGSRPMSRMVNIGEVGSVGHGSVLSCGYLMLFLAPKDEPAVDIATSFAP